MFKTIPTRMPWNLHTTLLPLPNCSHKISPNLISPPWDFSEISQGRSISKNTPVQNLSRQSPKMNTGKTKKKHLFKILRHVCAPFKKNGRMLLKKKREKSFPFFVGEMVDFPHQRVKVKSEALRPRAEVTRTWPLQGRETPSKLGRWKAKLETQDLFQKTYHVFFCWEVYFEILFLERDLKSSS